MANLKFADTHNMVTFLSKPEESDGFEQIVDFLIAQPIKYALTVNPTNYTSCIEQFWAIVKVKTVNGEVQIHALVDGKKIIINESVVRRDLQLEDAEGIDCLPNFYQSLQQRALWGAKTTAWNEFSSTRASAIICLATNQKFNFSKYIFESMVKNLDNVSRNFLMYPRFVQVFFNQPLDEVPTHKRIYDAPSHTIKIFENIKRIGKGFSGRVTPLFPTMVVQNQSELGEGSAMPTDPQHTPTFIQSSPLPKKTQKPRKPKRKDTQVPQPSGPTYIVADEAVHKELGDSLVRVATTASSLEAEQDSGGSPRCQETMGDTIAQTGFENVSKHSNDSLLARGNTLRSDEDILKLKELMELCTNLQQIVLDLEKTKTTQANEIDSLKRRVKKLERKDRERTHGLKRLHKVGMSRRVESSGDEDSLEVAAKDVNLTVDEVTLAQALAALKIVKPKVKGVVIQEPSITTTTISLQQPSQDKGKGIMLQAEFDEEERLTREKAEKEANVALIEEWDDIQAKIKAGHELAQRLQAEEQEELFVEEKAKLFQQLLEQRRKHFAAKSAK
ncbi:hypothetical protein Tco_0439312 [Tanacetum coccineum]